MTLEQIVQLAKLANDCEKLARETQRVANEITAAWGVENGYFGLSPDGAIRIAEQTGVILSAIASRRANDRD